MHRNGSSGVKFDPRFDISVLHANFITMFYGTAEPELLPIEISQCGNRDFLSFSAPVTLTLTCWPWHTNLTRIPYIPHVQIWTSYVEALRKLSSDRQTDRQTRPKLCFTGGQKCAAL